jgi:hypothetical protein
MHVVILLLFLSIMSFAQNDQPAPASLAGAPLVMMEKQMLRAERTGDLKMIENMLAPDFQEITPDGRVISKSEALEVLKTLHVDELTADNFRAQMVRDEIGIVTYTVKAAGTIGGQPVRLNASASSTWRRQKDRWQVVFHQNTTLPQPPASAAELEGLEQDLVAREADEDAAWLKQIFADDAVIVGPDGKRYTKPEMLADLGHMPKMPRKISAVSAHPLGTESGVVICHLDVQADEKTLPYISATVWKRGAAGWQVISHQYTRIEKP